MNEDKVKIVSLEIENVKRVQAVSLTPAETGLTIIGGDNRQGKSSCLDAIMSTLGGEKFTPSEPVHEGAKKGQTTITLSNGITVSRSFTDKGSYLKVDPTPGQSTDGKFATKSGQSLLNEFISTFALDLSAFLTASDKSRADILLKIIGVDLTPLEERHKKLYAESMPYDEEAGNVLLTPSEIMEELQQKMQVNARNRQIRERAETFQANIKLQASKTKNAQARVNDLEERLKEAKAELNEQFETFARMEKEYGEATAETRSLKDEDTAALKQKLSEIDTMNTRIRKNLDREKALAEVEGYHEEYLNMSHRLEAIKEEKAALLNGAKMPLEGLSVQESILSYGGHAWDCMSHAEQLIAATAICRTINPRMGFVLIDKLEAMDLATLKKFGEWLEAEGLQAITTRVSQGDECSIIIVDGMVKDAEQAKVSFE
jgi:DNA repair exonuclease SbcCD ATPase subunit